MDPVSGSKPTQRYQRSQGARLPPRSIPASCSSQWFASRSHPRHQVSQCTGFKFTTHPKLVVHYKLPRITLPHSPPYQRLMRKCPREDPDPVRGRALVIASNVKDCKSTVLASTSKGVRGPLCRRHPGREHAHGTCPWNRMCWKLPAHSG